MRLFFFSTSDCYRRRTESVHVGYFVHRSYKTPSPPTGTRASIYPLIPRRDWLLLDRTSRPLTLGVGQKVINPERTASLMSMIFRVYRIVQHASTTRRLWLYY
jgi:hypothetical protein